MQVLYISSTAFPLLILQKLKYVTMKLNLNCRLLSLNVRGIRSVEKRKAIFNWLVKSKSDMGFLQETYSTLEVELAWKSQWGGDVLFLSHGSEPSRGVMILVKENFDCELKVCHIDSDGRYINFKRSDASMHQIEKTTSALFSKKFR